MNNSKVSRSLYLFFLFIFSLLFLFGSCYNNRVYEKNVTIKNYEWDSRFSPSFIVEIKDTSVLYNLSVNIRHTEAYPFENIWVMVNTRFPDSTTSSQRIEVMLASDEGKWFGEGLGDIWDYSTLIQENAFFKKPGMYTFTVAQIMREDPLPEVMSIGIKVENTGAQRRKIALLPGSYSQTMQ